jgi:hypothetical protein
MKFQDLSPPIFEMIAEFLPDITSISNLSLVCKKFAKVMLSNEQEQGAAKAEAAATSAASKKTKTLGQKAAPLGTTLMRRLFLRNLERGLREFGLPLQGFLQVSQPQSKSKSIPILSI